MPDQPTGPKTPGEDLPKDPFLKVREDLRGLELPDITPDQIEELQKAPELPDIDHDAIDARMAKLERRARTVKVGYHSHVPSRSDKVVKEGKAFASGYAFGMSVAGALVGIPMICMLAGWGIDRLAGTQLGTGIGAIIGSIAGIVIAVRMANRANSQR